ncbi:IlvD/Edd family dehydratase [Phytohabitans houttuyneae]|uniref:IlvD/Edd family dehydratase n=1 Tax=Phytohabitans houttuyneae TaxID=1076126 RepID=UPI0015675914|nr:IlvD/Edd family dehydratase [Phytohabitans houttuyneae]
MDGPRPLRSQQWWDNPAHPDMTALYLERYLNFGLTGAELQSGRPIIGIAQTGSDLVPCNRHHLALADRVRAGVRDAGGIPLEFPVHPLQETGKRPTAALDRNLAYLGLVEILYGYPLDGVVLTTGCDKTTPACLMAAATVNLPAIVLSGGPMLNGYVDGRRAGSGLIIWQSRRLLAAGKIDYAEFMDRVSRSATSTGHCNTMGTALSMNSIAEALGMTLPGCAAIPAPYRERAQIAYDTGYRAVGLVRENLTPKAIMTREAFENAIVVASAIAGSTNCPIHVNAIARHVGVDLRNSDWESVGGSVPILANCAPAGDYLGEDFYHAGGVPAVLHALLSAGRLHADAMTVTGRTIGENIAGAASTNPDVIADYDKPFGPRGGVLVLHGNVFSSGMMKMSVITEELHARYLTSPALTWRAVVFDSPEDYHRRIDDPTLDIDEDCILVVRNSGNIAYPGSAEVVNMQPPTELIMRGIEAIPTLGDGRQSGTADAPSILNISPEAAVGGNIAILRTGDRITLDIPNHRLDVDLTDEEIAERWREYEPPPLDHQTPWQELFRRYTGQMDTGSCLDFATAYQDIVVTKGMPRDSH